jgi:cytochrome c-type biogenesis protein CcmH
MKTQVRFAVHSLILCFILACAGVSAGRADAQSPTPSDDEINRIAHQLYCPVCENTPLDVCPTEACRQWRDLIRQKLEQGWSEGQIKQYFVDQYGTRVLGDPPANGFNWLIYLIPPVIIVAGGFLLFRVLNRWKRTSGASSASAKGDREPNAQYVARLEDELKKRK